MVDSFEMSSLNRSISRLLSASVALSLFVFFAAGWSSLHLGDKTFSSLGALRNRRQ